MRWDEIFKVFFCQCTYVLGWLVNLHSCMLLLLKNVCSSMLEVAKSFETSSAERYKFFSTETYTLTEITVSNYPWF